MRIQQIVFEQSACILICSDAESEMQWFKLYAFVYMCAQCSLFMDIGLKIIRHNHLNEKKTM